MNIYLPKQPSPVEQNAANELSTYLQKAYGEEFAITAECGCEPGIYVGFTDFAAQRNVYAQGGINELNGAEAWLACAVDGSLVITGGKKNTDRGIIYAAEHFLEDIVGVRFWNAVEEYVPSLKNFSIDPSLNISGEPKMVMRHPSAGNFVGNDMVHAVRNRCNYMHISPEWGGEVRCSDKGHCHTVDRFIPREGLFEKHPEWFAWSEGLQQHLPYGQYCMNNEEFLQAFEKAFLDDIARCYSECDAAGKPRPHHFHISLDDTIIECECPLCKESLRHGGGTGNFLRFANRMARAAKKVYPNIIVEILAYQNYLTPPDDGTLPESNIAVRFAPVDIDILHSLKHPNNAKWLEMFKGWSELCKQNNTPLYVWDYNVTYTGVLTPSIRRLQEHFAIMDELGVIGNYTENEEPMLTDFWTLKHWLLMHLMENPLADANAIIKTFMQEYYGPAAPFLTQWMDMEEAVTENSDMYMLCVRNYIKAGHIPYENYIEGNRLFDLAEESVRGDSVRTLRVRQARASLDLSICFRYDYLHYMAQKRGETFPIPRETAGLRYSLTVEQTRQQMQQGLYPWEGARAMDQWQLPYAPVPMLPQFEGTGALQLDLADYVQINSSVYGYTHMPDKDSLSGYCSAFMVDKAPEISRGYATVRAKEDPKKSTQICISHNGELIGRELHLEDIVPDEYHLYHIADADALTPTSNTNLFLAFPIPEINLSGLGIDVFPGTKVSVWIRAKFSGQFYGGSADQPNAIFFDRAYIVPIKD